MTGKATRAHANSLRLSVEKWKVLQSNEARLRKTTLAAVPTTDSSGDEKTHSEESLSDSSDDTIIYDPNNYEQSTDITNLPISDKELTKAAKRNRKMLEDSEESEHGIPMFEMKKKLRNRNKVEYDEGDNLLTSSDEDTPMEVEEIRTHRRSRRTSHTSSTLAKNPNLKTLLNSIAGML